VGIDRPTLRGQESVDAHLVHRINESLGIVSREISDHLNLITIGEDGCQQRDALVCGKGVADQLFPGWRVTTVEDTVKLTIVGIIGNSRGEEYSQGF